MGEIPAFTRHVQQNNTRWDHPRPRNGLGIFAVLLTLAIAHPPYAPLTQPTPCISQRT